MIGSGTTKVVVGRGSMRSGGETGDGVGEGDEGEAV